MAEPMSSAVENPIINDAYEEPARWWDFPAGQPTLREGRRPVGYYRRLLRTRARTEGRALAVEEFTELKEVNRIRARVKSWREHGYPGVTRTTRDLLHHWQRDERERQDTGLSELIHEYIAQDKVQHELRHLPNEERTIRIDTGLLEEAESRTEATPRLVMGDEEEGATAGSRLTKERQAELPREQKPPLASPESWVSRSAVSFP